MNCRTFSQNPRTRGKSHHHQAIKTIIIRGQSPKEPASVVYNDEQIVLFYSGELHSNQLRLTHSNQLPVSAGGNTRKNRERFKKKCSEWARRVEITKKKSLVVSKACMAINWPRPDFKGMTFELWVLNIWVFNFCVRRTPLQRVIKT